MLSKHDDPRRRFATGASLVRAISIEHLTRHRSQRTEAAGLAFAAGRVGGWISSPFVEASGTGRGDFRHAGSSAHEIAEAFHGTVDRGIRVRAAGARAQRSLKAPASR